MTPRRTTPGLALSAAAALALGALAMAPAAGAAAPAGSRLVVTGLGSSTPGLAETGWATLTDANGVPVVGESITLTVDHGFFTSSASTSGARAGDLVQDGTTLTETTGANGEVEFNIGIARDAGFDDDGAVTTVVSAATGSLTGRGTADWSSAEPLNAGSVELVLSPRQETPVAPAVSGDRTFYDVVTRDQFGNPVAGEPVYLDYGVQTPDTDYSEGEIESNLDRSGDVWFVSYVPDNRVLTASWFGDSTVYADTAGTTTTSRGTNEQLGSATASFYDVDLARSTVTLAPTVPGDAAVGSAVTQTMTVVDQHGNPARGLEMSFLRFGPDAGTGEQRVDRLSNVRGQASYTFVGANPGTAKVTAVVTDGVDRRQVVGEVRFRHLVAATLTADKAKGKGQGQSKAGTDALTVRASKVAAGAKVTVFRVKGAKTKRVKVRGLELDEDGRASFEVPDTNKRKKTTYVVVVSATSTTFATTSAPLTVR